MANIQNVDQPAPTPTVDTEHITIIKPFSGWESLGIKELWAYRDLIYFMLWRDIKGRYQQMALGPLWIILTPLLSTITNTLIFNLIAGLQSGTAVPFALFNMSAVLIWQLFQNTVLNTASSLYLNKDLIGKVYFPRLIYPIVAMLSNLVDFCMAFIVLFILILLDGQYPPTITYLTIPIFVFVAMIAGLSIGLWLSTWIVKYRDISNFLGHGLRFLYFLSPIVYSMSEVVPEQWQNIYRLNPMTGAIEGFRWALFGEGYAAPDMIFVISVLLILPVLIGGAFYFRRTEHSIADIV